MLNFAATPKGVIILQQSGLMNECVSHLFERYLQKLDIICDNFGHGFLLSELGMSHSGMASILHSGIFSSYLNELKSIANKEYPFGQPHL